MAEIRNLDGSAVDIEHFGRNEKIDRLILDLRAQNDAGRVSAIAFITLTPEGWYRAGWEWIDEKTPFPWTLALEGALSRLRAEIANASIISPEKPEPPPDPDAA